MKKIEKIIILGLGCIYLMPQVSYAQEALPTEQVVQVVEELNSTSHEGINVDVLMNSPYYERYKVLLSDDEVITYEDLAKVLCYVLNRSPLYAKQDTTLSPYVNRLIKDGIWDKSLTTDFKSQVSEAFFMSHFVPMLERLESQNDGKREVLKHRKLETISFGKVEASTLQLRYGENLYGLYHYGDVNYVAVDTLEQLGFKKEVTPQGLTLYKENIEQNELIVGQQPIQPTNTLVGEVTFTKEPIVLGNMTMYGLQVGETKLIPLRSLEGYFNLYLENTVGTLNDKPYNVDQYIKIQDNTLKNTSLEPLTVELTHLFWNGEKLLTYNESITQLQPEEAYPMATHLYNAFEKVHYYGTVVNYIQGTNDILLNTTVNQYGMLNESILKNYEKARYRASEGYLATLFPETSIWGTLKYDVKGLKKGVKYEINRADDGIRYYVYHNSQIVTIPWGSISIPKNPPVNTEVVTKEDLEAFVNKNNYTSETKYLVWTDLSRQTTYVFEGKVNQWQLIKKMLCSTGNNKTPTPKGSHQLRAYVPYFGVEKGYRCKNAVQIQGDYLYHSVMFDVTGRYVLGGQTLGRQASHGCIRLSPQDSEWFYKTMPLKTKVIIR